MTGAPNTCITALQNLAATSDAYPVVLAGHGVPTDHTVYVANIAWLNKATELLATVNNAKDFKQGLIDAFPDLGMPEAIDFVTSILFPSM